MPDGVFKKGRVLSAVDIEVLAASGILKDICGAAWMLMTLPRMTPPVQFPEKLLGPGAMAQEPFTGRANIYAQQRGLVVVDNFRINAINRVHESMTLATLPNYSVVDKGQMVATVKIIPFAVAKENLNKALLEIGEAPVIRVQALAEKRVGLVITKVAGSKQSLIEKSETAMREPGEGSRQRPDTCQGV